MSFEKRDNSGALFKNDRKDKDSHPDYRGDVLIDGKPMWVSAWIKKSAKGSFMSLSFTAKEKKSDPISSGLPPKRSILPDDDMDGDSIPF